MPVKHSQPEADEHEYIIVEGLKPRCNLRDNSRSPTAGSIVVAARLLLSASVKLGL